MKPNDIFKRALEMGTEAYEMQTRQNSLKWGISVCGTPIQINKGMILGINWGGGSASDKNTYESQKSMPTISEFQNDLNTRNYEFLKRSGVYLKNHLEIDIKSGEFNYTNLCLFRSPSQKDLLTEDYQSSFETFKFLVKQISPTWIISLGTTNIGKIRTIDSSFVPKMRSFGSAKGCKENYLNVTFYCVPHPNAHLSKTDRDGIWENIFSREL